MSSCNMGFGFAILAGACLAGPLALADSEERTALVATRRIEPGPYRITLPEKLGQLEAGRDRVLAFDGSGRIKWVATEGETITSGEPVAILDSGLEQARVRQAKLRVKEARSELSRGQGLRESNALSAKGLENAETSLGIAEAELDATNEQLERTRLLAPFDGVVAETFAEPGEIAAPAVRVAQFMELELLRVELGIPDYQINEVVVGAEALLRLPALPDRSIQGEVSRIAPAALPGEHLFSIEVTIPNPDGELRPGMSARTRIVTRDLDRAIVVAADLAVKRGGRRVVFFGDGDRAHAVPVDDAILHGDRLVLSEDVPWRALVVRGHRDLQDGMALRVDNRILGGAEEAR